MLNTVYLLLGGNQGKVLENFARVFYELNKHVGSIQLCSSIYQTEPWGFKTDHLFLNQVIRLSTSCSAESVLSHIHQIEKRLGRTRNGLRNSSRIIDIDILFFNDSIIDTPELTVPHPRLHLRNFTLIPLLDIAPSLVHPVFQKTIIQLMQECPDKHKVTLFKKVTNNPELFNESEL
jgi:2-amino-4-hydroxy-6-hydroxymethyldihydropteridine diphosphokinase